MSGEQLLLERKLTMFLRRIKEWEEQENSHPSEAETLLMDIKQWLEYVVGEPPESRADEG